MPGPGITMTPKNGWRWFTHKFSSALVELWGPKKKDKEFVGKLWYVYLAARASVVEG